MHGNHFIPTPSYAWKQYTLHCQILKLSVYKVQEFEPHNECLTSCVHPKWHEGGTTHHPITRTQIVTHIAALDSSTSDL